MGSNVIVGLHITSVCLLWLVDLRCRVRYEKLDEGCRSLGLAAAEETSACESMRLVQKRSL